MLRSKLFRYTLPAILTVTVLPAAAFPQSQDSQSVAEAARRAREKKKDQAKPTKVITDETINVKKEDVQSAVAEQPKIPGAPEAKDQTGNAQTVPAANVPDSSGASKDANDEKLKKEITAVKEQIKQALMDLDLLQREYRLDQDAYYSKPNYGADTAGKQRLDDEKQQISDKQEEVARLKEKLADLQKSLGSTESTAP